MKTKLLSLLLVSMGLVTHVSAQDFLVADFEDKNVGDALEVITYEEGQATATVVADPVNETNKAGNIAATNWDARFKFDVTLPEGKTLADYNELSIDIYIGENAQDEWPHFKQFVISIDGEFVYKIPDSYPQIAPMSTWTTITYPCSAMTLTDEDKAKNSFTLGFGINSNTANYCVDNVKLIAPKVASEEGFLAVEDFEGKSIGDAIDVQTYDEGQATATVAADPENADNKVVNLVTTFWDPLVKFNVTLPEGKTLADYEGVYFDLYIPTHATDEWANCKQMVISIDGTHVYKPDGDYGKKAEFNTWTTLNYNVADMTLTDEDKAKNSFSLALGLNSNDANYYIDNVKLKEAEGSTGIGAEMAIETPFTLYVQGGVLYINSNAPADVTVYTKAGLPCASAQNASSIDLSAFASDIYIVKVIIDGKIYKSKIAK